MSRVCIVATTPLPINAFMKPHIKALNGTHDFTIVVNGERSELLLGQETGIRAERASIARNIAPFSDALALWTLYRLFRRERFDIVQSLMPKAGLLAMLAAKAAGVPVRVHWFTGQVWATSRGLRRLLLRSMDRVLAACATDLLADSASQREFLVREGIVARDAVRVLGDGSVCGVDTRRFRADSERRRMARRDLGVPEDAILALYLGRFNEDKGLLDLVAAFAAAARDRPRLHLALVGPDEQLLTPRVTALAGDVQHRLHIGPHTDQPEAVMAAADIFVLASRREGFGSTVIEAGACGVPAIGSAIYGLTDAIVDGATGLLVPPEDIEALRLALITLAEDDTLRAQLGEAARARVITQFPEARLTAALAEFYREVTAR